MSFCSVLCLFAPLRRCAAALKNLITQIWSGNLLRGGWRRGQAVAREKQQQNNATHEQGYDAAATERCMG
jgi:hypothetical protein